MFDPNFVQNNLLFKYGGSNNLSGVTNYIYRFFILCFCLWLVAIPIICLFVYCLLIVCPLHAR